MELKFTVAGRMAKPVDDVFEAVVDPDRLSRFFTTGGAKGRLEAGAEVTWDFHDFPGAFPVLVQEVIPNEKIVLQWEASTDPSTWTTITMTFQPLEGGRTLVRISEYGWPETEAGLKASFGNCEGWTGMLCAMKAWLEHGINLRDGFYK
ncbi:Uncharacterized conserved protein YndB, AHSA1/START domain [Paracoccus alcaliphilus]|uniref:Uncharacterized conserved protein YndB, AHSA1/START domain n=1 Tax=Paracoccus alcaliphilus TaxID=34002 RepID=A0A1H8ELY9_9RHOB|nr:SRPBCC family protein [Paracoccus alcaliphilus]WCR20806.1 SRPBCC family protein [Paracoccus alcaliphilus]SEN20601.1 Uncharacterized conserved protein YndB, AHSA1/START domain [Paracoccus alcaliphilus]